MRERPIAAYDALPLASKLEAILTEASAARSQDEYTAAGERAIRLLPQIMQALEADRKRRAAQQVIGDPAAWMHPKSLARLMKAKGNGDEDANGYAYAYAFPGSNEDVALFTAHIAMRAAPTAAQAVPYDMPADFDTLIIRYGNARYDAGKRVDFAARGEHENLSAELYAEIAARLAAAPTAQAVPEGVARIAAERVRQIENEGFTPNLDRRNYSARQPSQIILAAIAYLSHAGYSPDFREAVRRRGGMFLWPWDASWWKPGKDDSNASRVRELEKAGALIAAEIDRLLAAAPTGKDE